MATSGLPGRSLGVLASSLNGLRRWHETALWSLLALGPLLFAWGWVRSDVAAQLPWPRIGELIAVGAMLWLLPSAGALMFSRSRSQLLLAVLLLLALLLHGPVALLAVSLLVLLGLASAALLGAPLGTQPLLSLVCGLALLSGLAGWTLPWPLPLQPLLAVAAGVATLLLWRRRDALWQALQGLLGELQRPGSFWPLWVVGLGVLATGFPTLQFDDLAYHRALPEQLQQIGYARLDAWTQLWALAPWASDALQGWGSVLAGGQIRGALNLLWWLLLWGGLAEALRGQLPPGSAGRVIALGASLPLGWVLLGGMQTELPAAAALVALLAWLQRPSGHAARDGLIGGALAGLLLGLKLSHLAYLGPLLLLAALRSPRLLLAWLPTALPATLLVGGSSYTYATWISGSPTLPLFNGWFAAPQLPAVSLLDARYAEGLDLGDAFGLFFDSSRYYESWDGVAGWQFVLLLGPLLLGARRWPASALPRAALLDGRSALLAVLLGALLLFAQLQYLRYLYPALVLAAIPLVVGLASFPARQRQIGTVLLSGAIALNLLLLPNAHWQLRDSLIPPRLSGQAAEAAWQREIAPELDLIETAHALEAQPTILLTDPGFPYHADARGRTLTTAWYDSQLQAAAAACQTATCWQALWQDYGISHLIVREPVAPELAEALAHGASWLRTLGVASLHRVDWPSRSERWRPSEGAWRPQLSADRAWLLQLQLHLRCEVGQPYALRSASELLHYAQCPVSGAATVDLTLRQDPGSDRVGLTAEGLPPDAALALAWHARPDLPAERQATLPRLLREARQ